MGLLVEGFDSMPAMFQTHNPPYYHDLLTSLGLVKAMDWHAYKITNRNVDLEAMERRYDDIMREQNIEVVTYNPKELDRRADEIFHLFNTAWAPNWGHVPFTRRQFDEIIAMVKPCLRPGLAYAFLDNDRLAGFSIILPDLNPLIRQLNGRLTLWGKLRLLYEAKYRRVHKVRAMVLGISQPYQRRRLHHALILRSYINLVKQTPCDYGRSFPDPGQSQALDQGSAGLWSANAIRSSASLKNPSETVELQARLDQGPLARTNGGPDFRGRLRFGALPGPGQSFCH